MTGHRDRYGDPIDDDHADISMVPIRPRQTVKAHIAELRRILAESRARRSADISVHMDMDEFFPSTEDDRRLGDDLRHALWCPGGPLVTSQGYSVTTTTCQTCKAVASVRHGAS